MYQCSEDDAYETIKPRLESFNANCSNVEFIDEEMVENLSLDDEKIREAIVLFKPQLVVIDPLQSYIGEGCSIYTASRARKLMHNLSIWATKYKCAIVLISHFTKNEGTRDLYRGIGSIDVVAAARSVLQVETDSDNPSIKRVKQVKNNLAPKGPDVFYELSREAGFHWLDNEQKETVKSDRQRVNLSAKQKRWLCLYRCFRGYGSANEILELYKGMQLSDRTIRNAKNNWELYLQKKTVSGTGHCRKTRRNKHMITENKLYLYALKDSTCCASVLPKRVSKQRPMIYHTPDRGIWK